MHVPSTGNKFLWINECYCTGKKTYVLLELESILMI